jgi:WhiB family transcriptional regulator, redox-sensing transcriptional regulator
MTTYDTAIAELPDLGLVTDRPSWMSYGACRGAETSMFFVERGAAKRTQAAKAVCQTCMVRTECLKLALADPELQGVWGGTSTRERRAMRAAATA